MAKAKNAGKSNKVASIMKSVRQQNKTLGGARAVLLNHHREMRESLDSLPTIHRNTRVSVKREIEDKRSTYTDGLLPDEWFHILSLSKLSHNYKILFERVRFYKSTNKIPVTDEHGVQQVDADGKPRWRMNPSATGNHDKYLKYEWNKENYEAGNCLNTYSPYYILQALNRDEDFFLREMKEDANEVTYTPMSKDEKLFGKTDEQLESELTAEEKAYVEEQKAKVAKVA